MELPVVRNHVLLWVVGLYLILNYGMMLVRIPPVGNGVPIGELTIIFVLLTIHYPSTLPRLAMVFPVICLLFWWCYIFLRASSAVPAYGVWALRDATNVIESLFLLCGFVFAQRPGNVELFFKWIKQLLVIACFYGLSYPFAHFLQKFSPKIVGGAGQVISLIGVYTNTPLMMLWAAFFIMIHMSEKRELRGQKYFISVSLIGFTVMMFQARTIYLQILAIGLLFCFYRRDLINKSVIALMIFVFFISLFPFLDFKITGRLGQEVSIAFFVKHFMAIFGVAGEGLENAAYGVSQRTDWWTSIYFRLTQNWSSLLMGLGYGFPLIDFHVTGNVPVREPHNSYVSFVARSGLIGLFSFIFVHLFLLKVWQDSYRRCKQLDWKKGANALLALLIYFVLVWVFAIGEDAFEKPFNAIPYYFFWGFILRFSYHLKQNNIGPGAPTYKNSDCS